MQNLPHFSKICLKLEIQMLINALLSKQGPIELCEINLDIETLAFSFSYVSFFFFILRSLNFKVDAIAKSALRKLNISLPLKNFNQLVVKKMSQCR